MVDYPENYKKPTLVEYLANEVLESCTEPEDWDMCDLGEKLALELDINAKGFKMNDMEYQNLISAMEDFISNYLREELEREIAKKVKEDEANYREYREVIEEKH
jgi:hypothetical protein